MCVNFALLAANPVKNTSWKNMYDVMSFHTSSLKYSIVWLFCRIFFAAVAPIRYIGPLQYFGNFAAGYSDFGKNLKLTPLKQLRVYHLLPGLRTGTELSQTLHNRASREEVVSTRKWNKRSRWTTTSSSIFIVYDADEQNLLTNKKVEYTYKGPINTGR